MRGKLFVCDRGISHERITPADAGKMAVVRQAAAIAWDHPRGCGENQSLLLVNEHRVGSPPRMRGKLPQQPSCRECIGITPADAGKTEYLYPP